MARPLRIAFADALYRPICRVDRRESICADDTDGRARLSVLAETVARYNCIFHAYCLMTNHYHLVIQTAGGNLPKERRDLGKQGVGSTLDECLAERMGSRKARPDRMPAKQQPAVAIELFLRPT